MLVLGHTYSLRQPDICVTLTGPSRFYPGRLAGEVRLREQAKGAILFHETWDADTGRFARTGDAQSDFDILPITDVRSE